jgi:hypothetical protein
MAESRSVRDAQQIFPGFWGWSRRGRFHNPFPWGLETHRESQGGYGVLGVPIPSAPLYGVTTRPYGGPIPGSSRGVPPRVWGFPLSSVRSLYGDDGGALCATFWRIVRHVRVRKPRSSPDCTLIVSVLGTPLSRFSICIWPRRSPIGRDFPRKLPPRV